MAGGGGSAGELREGLPGQQGTAGDSNIFQISGTGADGGGRRLARSGRQSEEGYEDLDMDDENTGPGGVETRI